MTATVFTEAMHPCAPIVSEAPGFESRDNITIAQNQTLVVGQVLGKTAVVAGVTSSVAADAGNSGNGVFTIDGTTPVAAGAKDGIYRVINALVAANSGEFEVFDPDGINIGRVAVGATFNNQIKFVIADGSNDFAIGDAFSVTVGIELDGDEQYAVLNPTGTDGTQRACAVLLYPVTTGSGVTQKVAAITRNAEMRAADLTWPGGITAAQQAEATDQLRRVGIILR